MTLRASASMAPTMRRPLARLLVALGLLALPASAGAEAPPASAEPEAAGAVAVRAEEAAPLAKAPEAAGRIRLSVAGAHDVGGRLVTVVGRQLRIDGRIRPYVPGERVQVRIWRGRKLISRVAVRPKPTRTARTATFTARIRPGRRGTLKVFAVHERTAEQRRLVQRASVAVVTPTAASGSRSLFVALLQQRLAAVGYATPRSGVLDDGTSRAILAFRKVNGMARTSELSPLIVDRLMRGLGGFKVRFPQHGRHVEAHLGQQVLALIDRGRVVRAYHTSSGKPSTPTVLGTFRFYWLDPGTNSLGMVHSAYFIRGYAIHGYRSVPTYPASAGCLRVPVPDARAIYDWIRLGDRISVYY